LLTLSEEPGAGKIIELENQKLSPRPTEKFQYFLQGVLSLAEVGKMMTFYLRPILLPSTQQVDDLAFVLRKR
jgi:hypothetical protein